MHPIEEAILFLLAEHEKHALSPQSAAKAGRLIAEINAAHQPIPVPKATAENEGTE